MDLLSLKHNLRIIKQKMGKNKIETTKKIENKTVRNVTFIKRKKGLIKKAMELSMLCDLDIHVLIFDKEKNRLIEYESRLDV